jgi:hypothetical protein
MEISESKPSRRSSNLIESDVPSLLTIIQDEIETVIPIESNDPLSVKKTKTSSCGLNNKSLLQFGLMTTNLIFQIIILYKEYNRG